MKISKTNKLFWNKYPFKIVTKDPRPLTLRKKIIEAERDYSLRKISFDEFKQYTKLLKEEQYRICDDFHNSIVEYLTLKNIEYKILNSCFRLHIFFINETDMNNFIADNNVVEEIFKPGYDATVNMFSEYGTVLARKNLFWAEFEWKVTFKHLNQTVGEEFDNWVTKVFVNPNETRYNPTHYRCMYLKDEQDVLLLKLAYPQYIAKIEKITLI